MQFHSSVDKAVIYPAFGSSQGSDNEGILDVALADNNKVRKILLFGSGMHPGCSVFGFHSEYCVCAEEAIICALSQQQYVVVVHLPNAVSTKHPIPSIVILGDSGV